LLKKTTRLLMGFRLMSDQLRVRCATHYAKLPVKFHDAQKTVSSNHMLLNHRDEFINSFNFKAFK